MSCCRLPLPQIGGRPGSRHGEREERPYLSVRGDMTAHSSRSCAGHTSHKFLFSAYTAGIPERDPPVLGQTFLFDDIFAAVARN